MILTDLRVNHLTTPVGFLLQPIVFSWKVAENREAKRQKWARIVSIKNKTVSMTAAVIKGIQPGYTGRV